MSGKPRPDETRAADVVLHHCGAGLGELRFADQPNGVDFIGIRGVRTVALEVTRFTSPDRRRDPVVAAAMADAVPLQTRHSWLLFLTEHPAAGVRDRVEPALQEFERHRIRDYHASLMGWWLGNVPSLRCALATMASEHVVGAQVVELRPPRLFVATADSDAAADPDTGLGALETHLADEAHHLRKTAAAPAQERHLFIWVDGATPQECASAFIGGTTLPRRPPALPPGIGHLWVVHEQTGHGWHWQRDGEAVFTGQPDGWRAVQD